MTITHFPLPAHRDDSKRSRRDDESLETRGGKSRWRSEPLSAPLVTTYELRVTIFHRLVFRKLYSNTVSIEQAYVVLSLAHDMYRSFGAHLERIDA